MEQYFAIKKNIVLPSAAIQVDVETIMLSEINQTGKDKHCMKPHICGI